MRHRAVRGGPVIATLAMNPSVDAGLEVDRVAPLDKLRSRRERYDPGGGGVNVARVLRRLGADTICYCLAGGATGAALEGLLARAAIAHRPIPIAGDTRICANVAERATGRDFRFVAAGPRVRKAEWTHCLAVLEKETEAGYLVASGSLPRGVPADFYARVSRLAGRKDARMVLDSSGEALREGVAGGGVHLVKPSLAEFGQLAGDTLHTLGEIATAAMAIVGQGKAELIAVTMGARGALLASAQGPLFFPAIRVEARSAAGAGDSFVAAMVRALSLGWPEHEAVRFGIAAGGAAVITPGTEMCRPDDVERLYRQAPPGRWDAQTAEITV